MNFYRTLQNDWKFPFLFYRNKDVDKHNKKALELFQKNAYTLQSIDNKINTRNISSYQNDKAKLPSEIVLKRDMFDELIGGNVEIESVLINA